MCVLLWPPYVIGQAIIFLPCSFYISSIFFPRLISASQIGCLPYLCTWCGLSANLGCRPETCCMRLTDNTTQKVAIWTPSHNFVGLYLPN